MNAAKRVVVMVVVIADVPAKVEARVQEMEKKLNRAKLNTVIVCYLFIFLDPFGVGLY